MANPYYIDRRERDTASGLMDIGKLGLQLYGLKQQGDLGAEHNRLAGEDIALRGRIADQNEAFRKDDLALRGRQITVAEQAARTEQAKLGRQFTPFDAALMNGRIKALGFGKALEPEQKIIEEYGKNPNYTFGTAYDDFVTNWPERREAIVQRLSNDIVERASKDPNFAASPEAKMAQKLLNSIYEDQTGESVAETLFPGIGTEKRLAKEAALAEIQSKNKPPSLISVSPGTAVLDPITRQPVFTNPAAAEKQTEEQRNFVEAQRQGFKGSFMDYQIALKAAGKSNVNVTTKVGAESMTKLGEEMSTELVKERKDVMGAVSGLNNLKEAESLINSGIITGTGAKYIVTLGNLLYSRLGFQAAKDPMTNTQAFAATMGTQVGQIIKQFGSGTGLSDADREYAEKIVGGDITLSEPAIKRLMAINKKAFANVIKNYNKKAKQAMSRPGAENLPYDLSVEYDFDEKPQAQPGAAPAQERKPLSAY